MSTKDIILNDERSRSKDDLTMIGVPTSSRVITVRFFSDYECLRLNKQG